MPRTVLFQLFAKIGGAMLDGITSRSYICECYLERFFYKGEKLE